MDSWRVERGQSSIIKDLLTWFRVGVIVPTQFSEKKKHIYRKTKIVTVFVTVNVTVSVWLTLVTDLDNKEYLHAVTAKNCDKRKIKRYCYFYPTKPKYNFFPG